MIVHQDRRAVPLGAAVFEVADHFAFLAVEADEGQSLPLEAGPQRADVLALLIAVGAGVGGDLLAVDTQREMHLVEKTCDGVGRDGNIDMLEDRGDLLGGLAGPFPPGDGISSGIVLQKNLDGIDYFGPFFPAGLRPAPALRTRSTATS